MGRHGSKATGEMPSRFVARKAYDDAADAGTVGARRRWPVPDVGVGRGDPKGDSSRSQTPKASGMLNAMATTMTRTAIVRVAGAARMVTHRVSTRVTPFLTNVTLLSVGAGQRALHTAGCGPMNPVEMRSDDRR